MSKIEVNAIEPQSGTTLTLGASGDTITIPAGATISNSGTATGFGRTGTVNWDTTKKTTGFTAVNGVGYFCDTTSAAFTATLPATPSAGDIVAFSDYTGTWNTNNLTVGRNGSLINSVASNLTLNINNTTATFIYIDATEGWRLIDTGSLTSVVLGPVFVAATGGTITTSGDYKIHTFTGPGTFTVTCAGNSVGSNSVEYLVVAGGGGGGGHVGGGGGAGGLRQNYPSPALAGFPVTATAYPITVGAGGAGSPGNSSPTFPGNQGATGSNSVFSTITSNGGGGGGGDGPNSGGGQGANGGSGGGGGHGSSPGGPGGTGNTPPTSPSQGNNGGAGTTVAYTGGGGGGANAAGTNGSPSPTTGGPGGAGLQVNIDGNNYYWAGGGGGGTAQSAANPPIVGGNGGIGGGGGSGAPDSTPSATGTGGGSAINSGANGSNDAGGAGGANSGGGGGGGSESSGPGGSGGSGIVVIRYKFQ